MWDTSQDYRFKVADKSISLFMKAVESGSLHGQWNKKLAVQMADEIKKILQSLIYSYLEPKELTYSPEMQLIKEKGENIIEALGGEKWAELFLKEAKDKEKTEENIARIKFFLNTILKLKERIMLGKILDPIIGVDIIVGEVMSSTKHPRATRLQICNVNIGDRSIKVVTNDLKVKMGDHVAVALLPPQNFMGITSEGMFLGTEGVLRNVEGEIGCLPKKIPLESLNEARKIVEKFIEGK
ncbi:MAG: tRNA-binding protein [Methanothermobacter sp.]|nr:tRNA-binding protein [Methanothermobacter sp.]